jgi:hypothetical protein
LSIQTSRNLLMAHLCSLYLNEPESFHLNSQASDLENLVSRRQALHDFLENILSKYFIQHHKSEMKFWLQETLCELLIDEKTKLEKFRSLLSEFDNRNFEHTLFQELCKSYPREVSSIFAEEPSLFQQFFSSGDQDTRIQRWFDWFAFEGNVKFGALALQQFVFKHREWIWDKCLVWNSKRPVTPVIAANQPHLLLQMNVLATVKNLLKETSFWESKEFLDTLENGDYLVIDYSFFAEHLVTLWRADSQRGERICRVQSRLKKLIDSYIQTTSFRELCKRFFLTLSDQQLLRLLDSLNSVGTQWKLESNLPVLCRLSKHNTKIEVNCSDQSLNSDPLHILLFYNALFNAHRHHTILLLTKEESAINARIQINTYIVNQNFVLSSEESRKEDELLHWALRKRLFSPARKSDHDNKTVEEQSDRARGPVLSKEQLKFILLEGFLLHYRLVSIPNSHKGFELLMQREGIPYIRVKNKISKKFKVAKRNHPILNEELSTKREQTFAMGESDIQTQTQTQTYRFITWRVPKPNTYSLMEILPSQTTKTKRKRDPHETLQKMDTVLVNAADMPHYLSSLFVDFCSNSVYLSLSSSRTE